MNPPFFIDIPETFRKKIYPKLPKHKQEAFNEQIKKICENPHSHSLNLKKMRRRPHIYEARLNGGYRITMELKAGLIRIRNAGPHDILNNP